MVPKLRIDHEPVGYAGRREEAPTGLVLLPPPTAPMAVAREVAATRYTRGDELILRHWRGGWWLWARTRWVEVE